MTLHFLQYVGVLKQIHQENICTCDAWNEKLGYFYKSCAFIGTVKFKSLKWAGRVTRIDVNNKIIQNFSGETCWQVDTLETWRSTKNFACTKVNFLIW